MNKEKKVKKGNPVNFDKLQKVNYKNYYRVGASKFYNTKEYTLDSFYKPIANI